MLNKQADTGKTGRAAGISVYRAIASFLALVTITALVIADSCEKRIAEVKRREKLAAMEIIRTELGDISSCLSVAYWSRRPEVCTKALCGVAVSCGKIIGASRTADIGNCGCLECYSESLCDFCASLPVEYDKAYREKLRRLSILNRNISASLGETDNGVNAECVTGIARFIEALASNPTSECYRARDIISPDIETVLSAV